MPYFIIIAPKFLFLLNVFHFVSYLGKESVIKNNVFDIQNVVSNSYLF